jgi:hypothetical protein
MGVSSKIIAVCGKLELPPDLIPAAATTLANARLSALLHWSYSDFAVAMAMKAHRTLTTFRFVLFPCDME